MMGGYMFEWGERCIILIGIDGVWKCGRAICILMDVCIYLQMDLVQEPAHFYIS
jgi:hypothetical protein